MGLLSLLKLARQKSPAELRIAQLERLEEAVRKREQLEEAEIEPQLVVPKLRHSPKPIRCYVYFQPSNVLGLLVRPYYKRLPEGKIAIRVKLLNVEKRRKVWVCLPEAALMRGGRLAIGPYQFITIWSHSVDGKPALNPVAVRIRMLEQMIRALQDALKVKDLEAKAARARANTIIMQMGKVLEQLRRSVQYPGSSFSYEEEQQVIEGGGGKE